MRHLKAVAFVLAWLFVGCATKPAELTTYPREARYRVFLSTAAQREIDKLVDLTRSTRKEQAACLKTWAILHEGADRFAFVLLEIGQSNPYDSDSLRVWTANRSVPVLA